MRAQYTALDATMAVLNSQSNYITQQIAAFSNQFLAVYIEAGVIYWVICLVLSGGQSVLEERLDRHVAH